MLRMEDRAYLSEATFITVLISKYKQYELADMIGVSPSAFNKALHGHPVRKSDNRWNKLASIIKLKPEQLFG